MLFPFLAFVNYIKSRSRDCLALSKGPIGDGYIFYARRNGVRTPVLTLLGNGRALTTEVNREYIATYVRQKP